MLSCYHRFFLLVAREPYDTNSRYSRPSRWHTALWTNGLSSSFHWKLMFIVFAEWGSMEPLALLECYFLDLTDGRIGSNSNENMPKYLDRKRIHDFHDGARLNREFRRKKNAEYFSHFFHSIEECRFRDAQYFIQSGGDRPAGKEKIIFKYLTAKKCHWNSQMKFIERKTNSISF